MPATETTPVERCESCLQPNATYLMKSFLSERLCPFCFNRKKNGGPQPQVVYVPSSEANKARCEGCLLVKLVQNMTLVDGQHVCAGCAKGLSKKWFAVAVSGSDNKVKANIRKRFQAPHLVGKLGRVVIPKHKQARTTKDRWEVYADERLLGVVSAADHDQAMYEARLKFERPRKKSVYKPEDAQAGAMSEVRKEKHGRRVYYAAYDADGKMLGRVTGHKNQEVATVALTAMYGPKEKVNKNPRESVTEYHVVTDVKLAVHGGRTVVQNQRAMPGYLLVECEADDCVFKEIKDVSGVYSLLPFWEDMKYDDLEEGEVVQGATSLSKAEVDGWVKRPEDKPVALAYAVGDEVTLGDGPMKGTKVKVVAITGHVMAPEVKVSATILGREVEIKVKHTEVRK
jgi:transcription antitermination factor NusG